jgi:hypothetical protein
VRNRLSKKENASMRHRLLVLLATATALGSASIVAPSTAGAVGHSLAKSQHATKRAVVVPITIQGGQGTRIGARPMVMVRVGRSKPVPVLLDTGSSGLRIFAPLVDTSPRSGVTVTSQRDTITYSGGSRMTGVVAVAKLRLGRQPTAGRVPFSLVQQASCVAAKPTCSTAGGIAGAIKNGEYGILGIGTQTNPSGVISPILGMPGRLGRTWSVHLSGEAGALALGARVPSGRSVATTVHLPPRGTAGGKSFWADQKAPLCLAVGAIHTCVPGIFDSGTFQMQIWGNPLDTAPTDPGTTRVAAGTPVAVSAPGAGMPFWTFTTGLTKSKDTVTVHPGRPFVNTGVQAFYTFTITYDDRNGTLVLSRHA